MALSIKNELIATTNLVKERQLEARNSHNLRKMREAADNGEYFVTFKTTDLSDEFIMWLYKEKFEIYGLNSTGFTNYWECIDDPNNIGAYHTIKVLWED